MNVNLDNIPKIYGFGANKNKKILDWKNSVGKIVNITINDITYDFEILEYLGNERIKIKYKSNEFIIHCDSLKSGTLDKIINEHRNHLYDLGYIINNKYIIKDKITKPTSVSYIIKCIKCGEESEIYQSKINRNIIPKCRCEYEENKIINTNPWVLKYISEKDAKLYSKGSKNKVKCKCDICGFETEMFVYNLINRGFKCSKCSDKLSMGERLLICILDYLNIEYIHQFSKSNKDWVGKYRYDFYLPKFDCVVEVNGEIHTKESKYNLYDLNKIIDNDKNKKDLAIKNGISKYITIITDKTNLEYVFNNLINSDLKYLIDFSNIEKNAIYENFKNDLVMRVCEHWVKNNKCTVSNLCDYFKLSQNKIRECLSIGSEVFYWCDYKDLKFKFGQIPLKDKVYTRHWKKIKVIKDEKFMGVFRSAVDIVLYFENIENFREDGIRKVCSKNTNMYKGYYFEFTEEDVTINVDRLVGDSYES